MKSQLLTMWDGLNANVEKNEGSSRKIVVLGATNRPQDIDEAFLRRMPLQIKVDLPDESQRQQILDIFIKDIHPDPVPSIIDVDSIARASEGLSGSDLYELCRRAVLNASLAGSNSILTTDSILAELLTLRREKKQCLAYYATSSESCL